MSDLTLFDAFDASAPYQAHSETSRAAAKSLAPDWLGTKLQQVYAAIVELGPITDEDIASHFEMNPSTQRPRRVDLLRRGLIEADGWQLTRSGRRAVRWRAVR